MKKEIWIRSLAFFPKKCPQKTITLLHKIPIHVHLLVQIQRTAVPEIFRLSLQSIHQVRMAVPNADGANAAKAVQIALSGIVPDVLHGTLREEQWMLVEGERLEIWSNRILANPEDVAAGERWREATRGPCRSRKRVHPVQCVSYDRSRTSHSF